MKAVLTTAIAGSLAIAVVAAQSCSAADRNQEAARQVWKEAPWDRSAGRNAWWAAISPDGRYLIYVGGRDRGFKRVSALYVRDLHAGVNRPLTTPDPTGDIAMGPVISPDGNFVAYGWYAHPRTDLRLVTLDGSASPVFRPSEEWNALAPVDWSADGKQIVAVGNHVLEGPSYIILVSVADGSTRAIETLNMTRSYIPSRTSLSPDARYVVYDNYAQGDSGERDIFIVGTHGGKASRLVARGDDDRYPIFTPDNRGVLFLNIRAAGKPTGAWYQRVVDGKSQGSPELLRPDMGKTAIPIGFTPSGSFYYNTDESTPSDPNKSSVWMLENMLAKVGAGR